MAKAGAMGHDAHGSGPHDGDLVAALLDVRAELTEEERDAESRAWLDAHSPTPLDEDM